MSKNVSFSRISEETINLLNDVLDVIFIQACESKNLSQEKKRLNQALEAAKAAEVLGDSPAESSSDIQKKINVVEYKRSALSTWYKESLYGKKGENDVHIMGMFERLGANDSLFDAYAAKVESGDSKKFCDHVKKVLEDVFDMDLNQKLVQTLARRLADGIGIQATKSGQTMTGMLIKGLKKNAVQELFVRQLAQYASKTCKDIVIPTSDTQVSVVEYDQELRHITKAETMPKDAE